MTAVTRDDGKAARKVAEKVGRKVGKMVDAMASKTVVTKAVK